MSSVHYAEQKVIIRMSAQPLQNTWEKLCQTIYHHKGHGVIYVEHMDMIIIIVP